MLNPRFQDLALMQAFETALRRKDPDASILPPSLATAMEELASTPDAKARNRDATEGKRHARSTSVTGRHGRRPWHLQRAKALNRVRDRLVAEVFAHLRGRRAS